MQADLQLVKPLRTAITCQQCGWVWIVAVGKSIETGVCARCRKAAPPPT